MTTVEIPEGSLFGLANLPYGVFSPDGGDRRVGVRVGDSVLDLAELLPGERATFATDTLNPFLAQGRDRWAAVRAAITEAAASDIPERAVHPVAVVTLHLPFTVGDYVDFYASEHHATNLGQLFRPDSEPLTSNWKHLPVGYHGRAGTVVVSGTGIVRPCGQRKAPADDVPTYGPAQRLDIEAELGFVVGTGSALGTRISVDAFDDHVFGAVLVNDWSARDLQAWEYVPLGPHLGKSFATSVSPWVVPLAALRDARVPLPGQDPKPLPYLRGETDASLDIELVVEWNGEEVARPPYREMYWSPAQMLAHLTINGASTRPGDLYASGTISGPERHQRGAFIELTWGGHEPITVKGEKRTFLLDGDEVVISATAPGPDGTRIGFGDVTGTIIPAVLE
ncbi:MULTISPECIES: fumarylacetoacetase [unclassified Pseudonocardia]|uniref:fumarylacetoacetase n=1 Tax=unclassified Pseudonocardia TaxID=2619320 RepID=UPI0006CB7611|nr:MULTISPECIES: fumarylacetoacetase [unclassified Pseudonocardia]ALE86629.1 fumarylacetoacetase [Pseudonocardia sp. HH130629-09]ANY10542.1 fumarylacetoacetase [Pseudonocardia sp. HH130630-07]